MAHQYNYHLSSVRKYGINNACFFHRDKIARTVHCSNVHNEMQEWPQCKVLGFGNSPPGISLEKVKAGRKQFEEIIHQELPKDALVESLMKLLQDTEKYKKIIQF